ncbi:MAG: 3-isopropylmalate dehydratase small subunit [Hyphomicrobiaceae bacterium]
MEPFTTFKSVGIPIDIVNCDTDQIIPARFLRKPRTHSDYHKYLFHDLRFNSDGSEKQDFIFNRSPYRNGRIIIANRNWGCGSSREHAVYVLIENGIRAVIAPSFGDIHYNNCMKQGVLPVQLSQETCDGLRARMHEQPGAEITIDLEQQTVTGHDGATITFNIAPFDKYRMVRGIDDLRMTMQFEDEVAAFEKNRADYGWL